MKMALFCIFEIGLIFLLVYEAIRPKRVKMAVKLAKTLHQGESINPGKALRARRILLSEIQKYYGVDIQRLKKEEVQVLYLLSEAAAMLRPIAEVKEFERSKRFRKCCKS